MIMDKNSRKYRGFGFITFEDISSIDAVLINYDHHYLKGAWVTFLY